MAVKYHNPNKQRKDALVQVFVDAAEAKGWKVPKKRLDEFLDIVIEAMESGEPYEWEDWLSDLLDASKWSREE